MPPLDVCIEVVAALPDDLRGELAGFEVRPLQGGTSLRGRVEDSAALWGVLHRLHRARLQLRSVVSVAARNITDARPDAPTTERVVRIEVAGHAAGVIQMALRCDQLYLTPPSTTLVLRVADEDDLFRVLSRIEGLALEVRRIDVC